MMHGRDPASIPPFINDFRRWPTWNYTSYYDVYCTNGMTVPGERQLLMGSIYIIQYLIFFCLYIPSLIVIRRSYLFQHACYKLMFAIGVFDLFGGFIYTFLAGIFSLMGANYCDNNMILIIAGHGVHGAWGLFCSSAVILALNRCIDVYSKNVAEKLFGGNRVWFWAVPVLFYAALFSSDYDVPPIYNSVWSCYLFQIDFRPGSPPINDWFCFLNSCWVMSSLIILYSLLLFGMWRHRLHMVEKKALRSMQKKVLLQSCVICFSVFTVAAAYAIASFVRIPNELGKFATMALQLCSGTTSIVYLTMNNTIRRGVKELLGLKKKTSVTSPSMAFVKMTTTQSTQAEKSQIDLDLCV
ncbi:serpentine type 7TM GPCR chemoreceptor srt domain-containing protein [Ditylenchus destructor]|nr:serpentine type 7TM GPCR chemoreceptor srt domain-containing protein [Ditylenchus destructor]